MTRRRSPSSMASVVTLADVRNARRVETYRARLACVLLANRRALEGLFASGTLYTRQGSRAARDLLLAHEHLLRLQGALDRLEHQGDVPAPKGEDSLEKVLAELDTLLRRTCELGSSAKSMLGELS